MSAVDPVRVAALLGPRTRWRCIEVVAETGSTNDDVLARAGAGEPEGLVLLAGHQTGGHGRFDRRWEDVPGAGIALSALVRPEVPFERWTWLPLLAGLAVLQGLRDTCPDLGSRLGLKWPNDVLLDGDKCCGILAGSDLHAAVIGIGLNVSQTAEQLPVSGATSLALAGVSVDADAVVAAVLARLDEQVGRWESGKTQSDGLLRDDYLRASDTIGRDVRVQLSASEAVEGRAVDIEAGGALVVQLSDGERRSFAAGDVIHLRPKADAA